jgi:2-oxoglutarate ferredoxin oxidoreductase subunit alpha
MTPVILLTDGYLANGSEPWRIPDMKDLPEITPQFADKNEIPFHPYKRNCDTLARYWAIPGTAGLEHRIGGLEKTVKGTVSYLPENHELMVNFRAEKVARVAEKIPDLRVTGEDSGDLLLIGWGGSRGYLITAVKELQAEGYKVSFVNFNYINPLPKNIKDVFSRFRTVAVAELNLGQFASYLRSRHPEFRYEQINKVTGMPFTTNEIKDKCIKILEDN